ncbi:unnamed protein product [Caenorhabditis bovis]|uniref:Translation initiation factor beta propellor-like domain-containing protein n=1 Tax=Caenorhabditis bovis TaxID=2654633 RepID=A0A8S1F0U7_9PELO|nr:unnamed protein product [Caenorhabditis bovis]
MTSSSSIIILLIIILITTVSGGVQVNRCVLRCKDNHMMEMENEWSHDFTLPLLNLLKQTGNETAAYIKAQAICASNKLLEECVRGCNNSVEASIILAGIRAWQDSCNNLEEVRAQFPCWKDNGERLSSVCRAQTTRLEMDMHNFAKNQSQENTEAICTDFEHFSSCFTQEHGKYCGYRSEVITSRMFESNREAMFKMMKIRWNNLPPACKYTELRRDTIPAMVEIELNKEAEEDFSDPPGFVDNVKDEELVPDVIHMKPRIEEFEENCVVIFGIPVVGSERIQKLQNVLSRVLDKIDKSCKMFIPTNPEGGSLGVLFSEWSDKKIAEYAVQSLDGYAFDKSHTFSAQLFSTMKKMTPPDENWKVPEARPYNDVGDLWWWLQNDRCRDQFAVLHDKSGVPTVGVYTHMKGHEPELAADADKAERANWTETVFAWSPHGSYLATIHARGVILWGGPEFKRAHRFAHDNVQYVDFSPCEKYMISYAAPEDRGKWWEGEKDCIKIWEVVSEELKGTFSPFELCRRGHLPAWPFFKWSPDEKYFACLKAPERDKLEKEKKVDGIAVYETETFQLLNKRPIIIENIKYIEWSPVNNILAYYSECTETVPAEFGLLQFPSLQRLRSARIYNVADAQLFWQKSGKRLAIYTMRYNKKQIRDTGDIKYIGGCTYHIDIFEIDKKDVSLMNLPLSEPFIHFGWDPEGDKFCVLTGSATKTTPQVYRIEPNSHAPKLMSKLDAGVQFNEVQFAPKGGWLAVLSKMSSGGNVMFVDTSLSEAKRTNVIEHPLFNKGYWDPTGRYFVTCSTMGGRNGADLGYRVFTFQGRELCRKNLERLAQFRWRPRPPVKLSEQKLKEIKKNLKKIAARFIKQDDDEKCRASQEVVEKRRKIMAAFDVIRNRNREILANMREARIQLRGGVDTEAELNPDDFVDEEITIALSTTRTREQLSEEDERD